MFSTTNSTATRLITYLAILGILLLAGCRSTSEKEDFKGMAYPDTTFIFHLTDIGDSLYALKKDYHSFAQAMVYYDSAARLAQHTDQIAVKGYVAFCKASIYNAWNKDPQKTIQLFKQAADIYKQGKDAESLRRLYYCRLLIAHAYDNEKGKDSVNCVRTLIGMQDSLMQLPSEIWTKWDFLPDMAWVATNVNHYPLAEQLFSQIVHREWIFNNPETNNYLDHYYLTRARIDVYEKKHFTSPYLDSLREAFADIPPNFDKLYYGQNLASLYVAAGNYRAAYEVTTENNTISSNINDSAGISSMQNRLLQIQLESQEKDSILQQAQYRSRARLLWLLFGSLVVISFFSYRFFRGQQKYKNQSLRLVRANQLLDEKVIEVDLISKEMQHRVKNNLQMIQSLVYMQQRQAKNEETKANMKQMAMRIESIAALHNQLGQKETGLTDLKTYITSMLGKVLELADSNKRVLAHFEIDPLMLAARQSLPLGLILNEWITNSIKYARVDFDHVSVHISVKQAPDLITVEYFDSGQPVSCDEIEKGLGLTIVNLLKTQLKGEIQQQAGNCFHYRLTFARNGK